MVQRYHQYPLKWQQFGASGLGLDGDLTLSSSSGGSGALNAFSPVKKRMRGGLGDVNVVGCGDSTSATDVRIFKPWAQSRAAEFPAYTVVYYPPDGAGGYTAPVTIQTGTGPYTLNFYNMSITGSIMQSFMGGKFDTGFITPGKQWDLVWFNHGKNMVNGLTLPQYEGNMLAGIAETQLKLEIAGYPRPTMVVTDQYPNRDDNLMDRAHAAWVEIVTNEPTITRLNLFNDTTYDFADYTDNNHLTNAAYASKIAPAVEAVWRATRAGSWTPSAPWLLTASSPNYLNNNAGTVVSNFNTAAVTGLTAPTSFTLASAAGSITFTADAATVFWDNTLSQKMQATGAASPRINRILSATPGAAIKGKTVVLTAITFTETGAAGTVGRIAVNFDGTGGPGSLAVRNLNSDQRGGWTVQCMGPFLAPNDGVTQTTTFYDDSAASPDTTHATWLQWASLSAQGGLPRGV